MTDEGHKVEKLIHVTVYRDGVVDATSFRPSSSSRDAGTAREKGRFSVLDFVEQELDEAT